MFFKELPCDNYENINASVKRWTDSIASLYDSNVFWNPQPVRDLLESCPEFTDWLLENNLMIKSVAVTFGKNHDCCGPHTDTPPARFKLSWPVMNTQHTWNRWFRVKTINPTIMINDLGGTSYPNIDDLEIVDQREVLSPCIIDAGVIHDVWCGPDSIFPRVGLQCHLFKEPISL